MIGICISEICSIQLPTDCKSLCHYRYHIPMNQMLFKQQEVNLYPSNEKSTHERVICGVFQVAMLGYILFLIYMKDLYVSVRVNDVHQFCRTPIIDTVPKKIKWLLVNWQNLNLRWNNTPRIKLVFIYLHGKSYDRYHNSYLRQNFKNMPKNCNLKLLVELKTLKDS